MKLPVCAYCTEIIFAWEAAPMDARVHRECALRIVLGSAAHLEGRCHCVVTGSEEGDAPGLSKREAARASVRIYLERLKEKPTNGKSLLQNSSLN